MRKTQEKTLFLGLLLALLLFTTTVNADTDLIENGNFLTTTCSSITSNYGDCQKTDAINGWSAKFISDNSEAPISVQAPSGFKNMGPGITNVVPLDVYDQTASRPYRRTCIYQSLNSALGEGAYTFSWAAATRNLNSGTTYRYFDYKVGIMNADGTDGALQDVDYSWSSFSGNVFRYHFQLPIIRTNQVVYLCSKRSIISNTPRTDNINPQATGIGKVELVKFQDHDTQAQKPLNQNIIKNGDFSLQNCLGKETSGYACQNRNVLLYWSAHYIKTGGSAPISVQKRDSFASIPGSSEATRVVPLDVKDSNFNLYYRTCIKQDLGALNAGLYTLRFDSVTKSGQPAINYYLYTFKAYIENSDGSIKAMGDANYGFTQNSYRLRVNPFLVKARKTEQTLYLCSRRLVSGLFTTTLLPAGAGVTNVDLKNAGCPTQSHKTLPMDTGYPGCVTNDQAQCIKPSTCKIFTYNQQQNSTSCSDACVYNDLMKINPPGYTGYACSTQPNANYYDTNCKQYTDKGNLRYVCNSCESPYNLKTVLIEDNLYKRCLLNEIPGCTVYNLDGTCAEIVSNCQFALYYEEESVCVACKLGFILNVDNKCMPHVMYCERYSSPGICNKCVPGYFLFKNICYKNKGNCELFDDKLNRCDKCKFGFQFRGQECVSSLPCGDGQYRNYQGDCIKARQKNCQQYEIDTGDCMLCKTGFKFDEDLVCVPDIKVECPPNTLDYVYVIEFGQCKQVQSQCEYIVGDLCGACKQGYYLDQGICIKVSYQGLTQETGENNIN